MKPPVAADASAPESEATGLPVFHSWKGVYWLVLASFGLWLALLITLTELYS